MASGLASALRAAVINATAPTGATAGAAGTQSLGFSTSAAMKVRLNSTSSSATAAGTELTGTGYTAGGQAFAESQTAISSPANSISLPKTTTLSWTNGSGGAWNVQSLDITDSAGVRAWWGDFTNAPVNVPNGSTFQIVAGGITATLT
jgi:hypothetical protein